MRLVLLGSTGFVGHHLLPRLSAEGHSCLALTRNRMACRELAVTPRVELRQADVYDGAVLAQCFRGADAVVNLAGILNERGRDGSGFHRTHVELVETVITACRSAGVGRLVQMSALNAGRGASHYLISKGEAEDRVRGAAELAATILQPSVIFGEGDDFFNRFAALMKKAPVLPLACPEARLQPVWVSDVTAAIGRVLSDAKTAGETFVLVGPRSYSLRELVGFTARAASLKCRIIGLPDGLSRLQGRIMDFVPGKPFSSDNYRSLQTDNTSASNDLPRLGIRPRPLEGIVPAYLAGAAHQHHLDRYRRQVLH